MNKRTINESQANEAHANPQAAGSKLGIGLLGLAAVMLLAVLVATSNTLAQSSTVTVAAGETLEAICEGRRFQMESASRTQVILTCVASNETGEPTPPPPAEPTNTSQPPAEPTSTPLPPEPTTTAPAPPPVGQVEPYPGAPACEEMGLVHDPWAWHGIWDYDHGCHWNHEHKHDPNEVSHIFGPAGAWYGGTEISYPWQTPMENEHKHEAYGWIVRQDIPSHGRQVWIKAFRVQVHVTSAPFTMPDGTLHGGYLGRFHSYSLEAQVCNQAGNCGIVRTGGWIDFGHLEVSGMNDCVNLYQDPSQQETCASKVRRRLHHYHPDMEVTAEDDARATFFWYGRQGLQGAALPALHPTIIAVATGDASVNVDPNNPYTLLPFCPDRDCNKNDSTIQAHVVQFAINPDKTSFNGYTDRHGVAVEGCLAPGLDCIPLIIENAPSGRVQHRDDTHLGLSVMGIKDFDLSPPGEWWIEYPN